MPPARSPSSDYFPSSRHKNLLRISSSLQDFSKYSRLDLEQTDSGWIPTDASPPPASRRKSVRILGFVLSVLVLFTLLSVCVVYFEGQLSRRKSNYYVVIDCGSTGTRAYVYERSVDRRKGHGGLPFSLRSLPEDMSGKSIGRSGWAYKRMETVPGFDKLVRNESGLKAAVVPLLRWAGKQIPRDAHGSVMVFLYATAGVRRLPKEDSDWLLAKARGILKSSSFYCQKDCVKIISGMEEAYFGWIALNYHMNVLGSVPVKETFGSLDLGGSSLQITFETNEAVNDGTTLKLSIGEVNHRLSAYSLAGYGLNDAFDKSVVHLIRTLSGNKIDDVMSGKVALKHPCLQTGYEGQYLCSQCSALNQDGGPVMGGTTTAKGGKGVRIPLVGTPQWEECSTLAKATVNLSEWSDSSSVIDCDVQPCALSDGLPRPQGQFYAMSGFFVVHKFFNLTSDSSPDDLLEKGQDFCEKTWEAAKNSVVPQPLIEQYCFRAPYVASLLRDGLHIKDSDVLIGSGSITWTLGVALLEAGQALSSGFNFPAYGTLAGQINPLLIVVILVVPLLLFCVISFVGTWLQSFFRKLHLPLFRRNSATNGSARNVSSPFNFKSWSPITLGDSREKLPLSPTVSYYHHPFAMGNGTAGSDIQLMESSLQTAHNVRHSYSSVNLGQEIVTFRTPHRSHTPQPIRRLQSREDLNSSLTDLQILKS